MSRVHDMGGRFGDGAVVPEAEGIVYREDWHRRALAVVIAAGALGRWTIDASRDARESVPPQDYARFSYYEKWLAGLTALLVETGLVSRAELAGAGGPDGLAVGASGGATPLRAAAGSATPLLAADVARVLAKGSPSARSGGPSARFAVGDAVRTRRLAENLRVPGGHTRLPRYAAGVPGRIAMLHGTHVFADAAAHGSDAAQPLYAVVFAARDLWAFAEHPGDEVVLDLWQDYLEPDD